MAMSCTTLPNFALPPYTQTQLEGCPFACCPLQEEHHHFLLFTRLVVLWEHWKKMFSIVIHNKPLFH
jgi:hypothetical protein